MIAPLLPLCGRHGTIRACRRSESTIGIAVRDLATARARYEQLFGRASRRWSGSRAGRRGACAAARRGGRVGCWRRSPRTPPLGRFPARRGEGMHHLAFGVDDLPAALGRLHRRGDADRRASAITGIYGAVAFVHPRVARRGAERAGAGDDGDGGAMDCEANVKFELLASVEAARLRGGRAPGTGRASRRPSRRARARSTSVRRTRRIWVRDR
jgi:methylmalonyl-CoA/ethylmalonyl-CoA epimerase